MNFKRQKDFEIVNPPFLRMTKLQKVIQGVLIYLSAVFSVYYIQRENLGPRNIFVQKMPHHVLITAGNSNKISAHNTTVSSDHNNNDKKNDKKNNGTRWMITGPAYIDSGEVDSNEDEALSSWFWDAPSERANVQSWTQKNWLRYVNRQVEKCLEWERMLQEEKAALELLREERYESPPKMSYFIERSRVLSENVETLKDINHDLYVFTEDNSSYASVDNAFKRLHPILDRLEHFGHSKIFFALSG